MLETPNGTYWQGWLRFVQGEAIASGWVSPDDLALFKVTTSVEEATAEIIGFYRNYHSCRWVGDLLVLRLQTAPSKAELADLNRRFGDIVSQGSIRNATAFPPERSSQDFPDLPRLRSALRQVALRPPADAHRCRQRMHGGLREDRRSDQHGQVRRRLLSHERTASTTSSLMTTGSPL